MTDLADFNGMDEVWKKYFKVPPPRTTVGTTGLLIRDTLVEIDLVGYVPRPGLTHRIVVSGNPKPLANYSEAVVIGNHVFAAGQLSSDFVNGIAPEARRHPAFPYYGSDIKLQTEYIMQNLKRTFQAAGSSLVQIRKAPRVLTDLHDLAG